MYHFFSKKSSGFGTAELVISIGIMAAMTTVVLVGQRSYTEFAELGGTADDIELSLRQAQVYGVSVREFSSGSNGFETSYGLSFNLTSAGSNDAYIFFGDRGSQNSRYDSGWGCPVGGSSECISKTELPMGISVSDICYITTNDAEGCDVGGVDITFSRPEPQANIRFINASGGDYPVSQLKGARITISSSTGPTREIVVYATGQISRQ